MDRIEAWKLFAASGKIEDYLKFKEIADETEYGGIDNPRISDGGG